MGAVSPGNSVDDLPDRLRSATVRSAITIPATQLRLADSGSTHLADDLVSVLDTKWFGVSSDPGCPAGIVAKLGYDLFLTRGITPTFRERARTLLLDQGTKQLLKLIAGGLLAAILFWLGFDAGRK